MIKNKCFLPPLMSVAMYAPVVKILGITPPDNPRLYIFTRKDSFLVIQAADSLVKKGRAHSLPGKHILPPCEGSFG